MRRFGTDGVRGIANIDLTVVDAVELSVAAAEILCPPMQRSGLRPKVIIGRDTRPSGTMLAHAVSAGLCSAGIDVYDVGIIPTPGVAHLVAAWDVDFGVMISASHNPMPDNGIKFFDATGGKLSDTQECAIENIWNAPTSASEYITGADVGRIFYRQDAWNEYGKYLRSIIANMSNNTNDTNDTNNTNNTVGLCSHLTIVVDAANGAAGVVAPEILRSTGAHVITINANMDGDDINANCGSTHIAQLQKTVIAQKADLGIAYDGDADRCLAVDEKGNIVDGDAILAILAIALAEQGLLKKNTVVTTVMSNYGLHVALQKRHIDIITTAVGDRYVLQEMIRGGYSLGGEQSGHIILTDYTTTGDGILTSLFLSLLVAKTPLSRLALVVTPIPQVLINVPVRDKNAILSSAEVKVALAAAQDTLLGKGRVLLRPSGTEEIFRVMVESENHTEAERIASSLAHIISQH